MATISGVVHAQPPAGQVKLLFSDDQDVAAFWGKLRFGATPMRRLRDCANPGFALAWCSPREDGAWDVLAQRYQEDETVRDAHQKKRTWTVVRATTRDGEHFENVRPLFGTAPGSAIEPGRWTDHLAIACNSEAKQFLALKLGYTRSEGFGYRAFFSADGNAWKEHPENPLYFNGDSMGLLWSPKLKRFVSAEKSYRGNGFWYHDRAFLVVLKVVPDFEREHCVLQDCNRIDQPLRWKGDAERSARELAGRTIRLRFYLRGANVYAVTSPLG